MSTKDNFEQDRERKRREAMTGDQRALESALAAIQALKEGVDTLKEWQSRFAINGKTVTGGDGDNQWAINAGTSSTPFDPDTLKIYAVDGTVLKDGVTLPVEVSSGVIVNMALYIDPMCDTSTSSTVYSLFFRSETKGNSDMT